MAVDGIEKIPLDALQLTIAELQSKILLADIASTNHSHGGHIKRTGCAAWIVQCEDWNNPEKTPFLYYTTYYDTRQNLQNFQNGLPFYSYRAGELIFEKAVEIGAKVVSLSISPYDFFAHHNLIHRYDSLPFAVIQGTANDGRVSPFHYTEDRLDSTSHIDEVVRVHYDSERDIRVYTDTGDQVERSFGREFDTIKRWIDRDVFIFAAGYLKNPDGSYQKHPDSNGCVGFEESCVWLSFVVQLVHPVIGLTSVPGTSLVAPRIAVALGAVLSVYPTITPENLVLLTRSCARPEDGLTGLGVADFNCLFNLGDGNIRLKGLSELGLGLQSQGQSEGQSLGQSLGLADLLPSPLPGPLSFVANTINQYGREYAFTFHSPKMKLNFRSGLNLSSDLYIGLLELVNKSQWRVNWTRTSHSVILACRRE